MMARSSSGCLRALNKSFKLILPLQPVVFMSMVDADQGRAQGAQIGAGGDISSFTDTSVSRMHRPLILCSPWIAVVP